MFNNKDDRPFWVKEAIEAFDLDTAEEISMLTNEQLLSLEGVGPATLEDIREMYPYEGEDEASQDEPAELYVQINPGRTIKNFPEEGEVMEAGDIRALTPEQADYVLRRGYGTIVEDVKQE